MKKGEKKKNLSDEQVNKVIHALLEDSVVDGEEGGGRRR